VFSRGWPLKADAWEDQAFFVASHGYRAIAYSRSGQPWADNDIEPTPMTWPN
jgi:non-heme chloroperoxidase